MTQPEVSLADIRAAQRRIAGSVLRTPVLESPSLDETTGARLYFKCESLQPVGAFKLRGASNAIEARTSEQLRAGVVTHSSGNHGAAVAYAARRRNLSARIVMPRNASAAKLAAVRSLGAQVLLCEPTLAAREAMAAQVASQSGALFIHPYDDPYVIAGQGTIALELLEQVPQLEWLLCPVGGGGLASGLGVAVKALRPDIHLIAVEPAAADDAQRSFAAGALAPAAAAHTIADGLRATLSARTFELMRAHFDAVVTVDEAAIVRAMRALWQNLRIIVEASSAVPFAAVLERSIDVQGAHVGIVLTGGNVDLDALPW
ncbi:MAG: threonine/serine dehydratase [Steroidobacteraceae bacterium]